MLTSFKKPPITCIGVVKKMFSFCKQPKDCLTVFFQVDFLFRQVCQSVRRILFVRTMLFPKWSVIRQLNSFFFLSFFCPVKTFIFG